MPHASPNDNNPLDDLPPLPDPVPANDRGFLVYGGSPVQTSRSHIVRVQESSAASGPYVWIFTEPDGDPHLSLADAIEVRDRLDQFIQGASERWGNGLEHLEEARRIVMERRTIIGVIPGDPQRETP